MLNKFIIDKTPKTRFMIGNYLHVIQADGGDFVQQAFFQYVTTSDQENVDPQNAGQVIIS